MDIILLLLTILILSIICYSRKNLRHSPLAIFIFIWGGIIILYSFRLYGIYDVRSSTLTMYFIGILMFSLGYLSKSTPSKLKITFTFVDHLERRKKNILNFCIYVSIVVLIFRDLKAIPYWVSGNISGLKSAIVDSGALSIGLIGNSIYTFIAKPLGLIMVIYSTILIFNVKRFRNKQVKKFLILTLIYITLIFIGSGSKTSVTEILFMIISYMFIYEKISLKAIFKRYRKLAIGLSLLSLIIVNLMLLSGDDFIKNLYFYFVGCIPFSDYALRELSLGPKYLGLVSLNGAIRVFFILPWLLGIAPGLKIIVDTIFLYMQQFESTILVAPGVPYNAFISMFTYFYADGGYFGVAIGSFLFGFICSLYYKKSLKRPSLQSIAIVLLLVNFIILSMVRFQLSFGTNVMSLLFIYLLFPSSSFFNRQLNGKREITDNRR